MGGKERKVRQPHRIGCWQLSPKRAAPRVTNTHLKAPSRLPAQNVTCKRHFFNFLAAFAVAFPARSAGHLFPMRTSWLSHWVLEAAALMHDRAFHVHPSYPRDWPSHAESSFRLSARICLVSPLPSDMWPPEICAPKTTAFLLVFKVKLAQGGCNGRCRETERLKRISFVAQALKPRAVHICHVRGHGCTIMVRMSR